MTICHTAAGINKIRLTLSKVNVEFKNMYRGPLLSKCPGNFETDTTGSSSDYCYFFVKFKHPNFLIYRENPILVKNKIVFSKKKVNKKSITKFDRIIFLPNFALQFNTEVIAQLVRALVCGAGGRGFEPH